MNSNIELIENDGDLKRTVWQFSLSGDVAGWRIYFNKYLEQVRATKRHRFCSQFHYDRYNKINNNLMCPEIPIHIKNELKTKLIEMVNELEIIC
jgi:hypothetical protein